MQRLQAGEVLQYDLSEDALAKAKERAAELRDVAIFKQPPPREECPICMLPLPLDMAQHKYNLAVGRHYAWGVFMQLG